MPRSVWIRETLEGLSATLRQGVVDEECKSEE